MLRFYFILFFTFNFVLHAQCQYSNTIWNLSGQILDFSGQEPKFYPGNRTYNTLTGEFVVTDCYAKIKILALGDGVFNGQDSLMKGSTVYFKQGFEFSGIQKYTTGCLFPGSTDSFFIMHNYSESTKPYYKCGYDIVDLKKQGGLGEVVAGNTPLNNLYYINNCMAIMDHANGRDKWIISCPDSVTVHAYLLTSKGISNTPVISSMYNGSRTLPFGNNWYDNVYALEFITPTHDSKQLIITGLRPNIHKTAAAFIYDFDNATGKFSNGKTLLKYTDVPYSDYCTSRAAISPNDSFIYFGMEYANQKRLGDRNYFFQINRFTGRRTQLANKPIFDLLKQYGGPGFFGTTLAPDGKIYSIYSFDPDTPFKLSLYRVNQPNVAINCKFKRWCQGVGESMALPTTFSLRAQPYLETNASYNPCADTTVFTLGGDTALNQLILYFGDGDSIKLTGPLRPKQKIKHYYKADGDYPIAMVSWNTYCNTPKWFTDTITVYKPPVYFNYKLTNKPDCFGDSIQLKIFAKNTIRFTSNWGKVQGKSKDTIANTKADSVAFSFYYPKDTIKQILTLSAQNGNCSVSDTVHYRPKYLESTPIEASLSANTVCGISSFEFKDSTSGYRTATLIWQKDSIQYYTATDISTMLKSSNQDSIKNEILNISVINQNGCITRDSFPLTIHPTPSAIWLPADTVICAGQQMLSAEGKPIINPIGTSWKIADGAEVQPGLKWNKYYSIPGIVKLKLSGKSPFGCEDSNILSYRVTGKPKAGFASLKDSLCLPQEKLSTIYNAKTDFDTIKQVFYTLGNGDTLYGLEILNYTYPTPGNYEVKQWVVSSEGCGDSTFEVIRTAITPITNWQINETEQCFRGNKIELLDLNTDSASYQIDFGDGTKARQSVATHLYKIPGKYDLKLKKINSFGCVNKESKIITIYNHPTALAKIPLACTDELFYLLDQSKNGDTTIQNRHWWWTDSTIITGDKLAGKFKNAGQRNFTLAIVDHNRCSDTLHSSIQIYPTALFKMEAWPSGEIFTYNFKCIPDSFFKYSWDFETAGKRTGNEQRIRFTESDSIRVSLTVESKQGCAATQDTTIFIQGLTKYLFPNAFTPGNDGKNDGFGIAGPEYVKQYKLHIFNRWGEKVFYTENPYELWQPQNPVPGEYIYKALIQDIYSRWKEVDGVVMLLK